MLVMSGLQVLTRRAAPGARKPTPFVRENLPAYSYRTVVVPRAVVPKCRRLTTSACEGWFKWYAGLLERRPLTTKMITNGFLAACGDIACQTLVEQVEIVNIDQIRSLRFFVLGSCLTAPVYHFWFGFLDRKVARAVSAGSRRSRWDIALRKLALDQGIMPHVFNPLFVACVMVLEGRQADWLPHMEKEGLNMLIANWQLWVPMQLINFSAVPVAFQVLFMNFVSAVWVCYLSYSSAKLIDGAETLAKP